MTRRQRERRDARRQQHQERTRPGREERWLARMVKLEDELGPMLPDGYGGGVVATARARAEQAKGELR